MQLFSITTSINEVMLMTLVIKTRLVPDMCTDIHWCPVAAVPNMRLQTLTTDRRINMRDCKWLRGCKNIFKKNSGFTHFSPFFCPQMFTSSNTMLPKSWCHFGVVCLLQSNAVKTKSQWKEENMMETWYFCLFHVFTWGMLVSSSLHTDLMFLSLLCTLKPHFLYTHHDLFTESVSIESRI